MRPFEGIRVIDVTHVLAGPFAAYQLGVLGADVIKVEHPDEPDQSRGSGTDKALNRRNMGTAFLTQASNKRSIALDLKTERDREILKKLVATAECSSRTTARARSTRWASATRRSPRSIRG
jgi:crotonobetainyl-CoA:carnitine CoA-transferase CaiB-like acyl-CoA transferase